MSQIKNIVEKILVFPYIYRLLHNSNRFAKYEFKSKTTEEVFTTIHDRNTWGGKDSISGSGSDSQQTKLISTEMPNIFSEFKISTMLDIPCGDFHWMQSVDLSLIDYTGADIVDEIIEKNKYNYKRDGVNFIKLNMIDDELPKVNLVFCRDCFVHFAYENIFSALENICNSQSEYILTTTFTDRKNNKDIVTGQWRPINLELAPFNFPRPIKVINENCTEGGKAYKDKSLGLWKVENIKKILKSS